MKLCKGHGDFMTELGIKHLCSVLFLGLLRISAKGCQIVGFKAEGWGGAGEDKTIRR